VTLLAQVRQSRFLRFAIVGAAGFVVDEGVLFTMQRFAGLDPLVARAISIFAAMTFTWWGNRTLTFREHAASGLLAVSWEWLRFVAANLVGALVNYGSFATLVHFAPAPANNPYLATAIGVGIGLLFNFTLSKRLVFRPRSGEPL
jgi:putative flippase GtrA